MRQVFDNWFERYFGSEETILLSILLILSVAVVAFLGAVLGPLFAALIIAFILQGLVNKLQSRGLSKTLSFAFAYAIFMLVMLSVAIGAAPIIGRQTSVLLSELPLIVSQLQDLLKQLPERYSEYLTAEQVNIIWLRLSNELGGVIEQLLSLSINSFPGLIALMVYLFLVPLLVFFMLKDHNLLIDLVLGLLPQNRPVMRAIWAEMDIQVSNYIRGKAIEILLVGMASFAMFLWLDLKYAALLALLVGLSVLVPYIGAAIVTIPVLLVGYAQWGLDVNFIWLCVAYGAIQFLDGNLLVPILFSEVNNLHPVAIITAVLLFGGIWGFWGVFFAIPLATFVKAIYNAWPRPSPE